MHNKITYPQEIIVWDIFPLLRRELAIEMKNQGLSQKKISVILGVTEAAISQYFNDKRAVKIEVNSKLKKEISISAKRIIKDQKIVQSEMQRLLSIKEIKNLICTIHKTEFGASKNCSLCSIGAK